MQGAAIARRTGKLQFNLMTPATRHFAAESAMKASKLGTVEGLSASPVEIDWHSNLPIYASEAFLKTVGDEYGWLGGLDRTGQLRCVLPYTIVEKPFIRMVRFRVETIPIGGELTLFEEKSFLNNVVEYFRSIGADMIIPATTNTIFRVYPDGALFAPYGTYLIDLDQPEEILLGNLSASHRRKIRIGLKSGVQIRSGIEYTEISYHLIRETLRRSKLPFMRMNAFKRMVAGLGNNVKILVAEYKGTVQGCSIVPFSSHSAYYVYGGSVAAPVVGAMHLLHWHAIQLFRRLGIARYDFVGTRINPTKGSKQEGLMMFKERFGARLVKGFMWKIPIHSLQYFAYSLGVRIHRGGDIVDQEQAKLCGTTANP